MLAGCEEISQPAAPPDDTREPVAAAAVAPIPTSTESAALRAYLAQVQSSQISQGLLRRDGGGPDTPYTSAMLARNFERVAFFSEFAQAGIAAGSPGVLQRWQAPIRMQVIFGPTVPPSKQARDKADIEAYAKRLARVTGHPVSVGSNPNFLVYIVSEDDRTQTINRSATRLTGVDRRNLADIRDIAPEVYCAVATYGSGRTAHVYSAAIAVIRAENPDLLRLSCIHEELAQGMGLSNDSPRARPSIFNDDDEFALLTSHDEDLLGMLYDPRLAPGITLAEARPIIRQLAEERVDGAGPS